MNKAQQKFNVVVIGGGPAGMMAALQAAKQGAKVLLVEKNKTLGNKLLLTGKGRCNLTQIDLDQRGFVEKIEENGRFLFSSLAAFGPEEVINFFQENNLPTKRERGGRVFPVSDKAEDVLAVLLKSLRKNKVEILTEAEVFGFDKKENKIESVKIKQKNPASGTLKIQADKFILTVGGKAYPGTGSTGDGYGWARNLGHTVVEPAPALVPLKIKEAWIKDLQGLSLKNVQINVLQNGKKHAERFGEMLFTHFGVSGPIILDVSKKIGKLLKKGGVSLQLDLKPALSLAELDQRLQKDFFTNQKKDFKNYLPELLPQKMLETISRLSGIEAHRKLQFITAEERKKLAHLLKTLTLTVGGLLGFEQAIVTSGGVATREINPQTMQSKIISNLFWAGEILDVDGPTGGYNLQICWSTGYVAGTNAGKK
jgi:predicted Rossmann fold flavoprotein